MLTSHNRIPCRWRICGFCMAVQISAVLQLVLLLRFSTEISIATRNETRKLRPKAQTNVRERTFTLSLPPLLPHEFNHTIPALSIIHMLSTNLSSSDSNKSTLAQALDLPKKQDLNRFAPRLLNGQAISEMSSKQFENVVPNQVHSAAAPSSIRATNSADAPGTLLSTGGNFESQMLSAAGCKARLNLFTSFQASADVRKITAQFNVLRMLHRLEQLSGKMIKGILFTNSPFWEAEARRLGLLVLQAAENSGGAPFLKDMLAKVKANCPGDRHAVLVFDGYFNGDILFPASQLLTTICAATNIWRNISQSSKAWVHSSGSGERRKEYSEQTGVPVSLMSRELLPHVLLCGRRTNIDVQKDDNIENEEQLTALSERHGELFDARYSMSYH